MKGFAREALILLPKESVYEKRNATYKYNFRLAVDNVIKYLEQQRIQAYGLYTDDVMRLLRPEKVKLLSTLSLQDSYFAAKHCDNMRDALTVEKWDHTEIIDRANKDIEGANELSESDRFALLLKHDKKVTRACISSFKIVFEFNYSNAKNFNAVSKPGDDRICVKVDALTFSIKCFISGNEVNSCELLNVPYASKPIMNWEV